MRVTISSENEGAAVREEGMSCCASEDQLKFWATKRKTLDWSRTFLNPSSSRGKTGVIAAGGM